jgi:hypothetical protein
MLIVFYFLIAILVVAYPPALWLLLGVAAVARWERLTRPHRFLDLFRH